MEPKFHSTLLKPVIFEDMMRSLKLPSFFSFPLYLFLLPVFFVLHGFTENYFLVPVNDALLVLGKDMVAAGLLLFLTWIVFRSVQKAALLSFFLMCVYYFFGYVQDVLRTLFVNSFFSSYIFLLGSTAVILSFITHKLKRSQYQLKRIVLYLNFLFLLLLIIDVASLIIKSRRTEVSAFSLEYITKLSNENLDKPDVYLMVVDEYAGKQALKDVFNFDNGPFLNALSSRGFHISEDSRSNYNLTLYSMASLFSMDYLSVADEVVKVDPILAYRAMFNNPAMDFLKYMGYDIYNQSWFDFRHQSSDFLNSFVPARSDFITSQTLINRIKKEALLPLATRLGLKSLLKKMKFENRLYNQTVINSVEEIITKKQGPPKFVYAHFSMPHFPFYYDRNGKEKSFEELEEESEYSKTGYTEYLQYVNNVLIDLIDLIKEKSSQPPVIILISDHGFRKHRMSDIDYTYMNLFSVSIPNSRYDQFTNVKSLVNLFRALFNELFSAKFAMLPHYTKMNDY